MESNNTVYWIWLSSLVKLTARKRFELLEHFRDPAYIWHAETGELESLGFLTTADLACLCDRNSREAAKTSYEDVCRKDMDIVTLYSPGYPALLKCIYDPPSVLYVKGTLEPDALIVAMVGSRRATQYGLTTSETLAQGLAGIGLTIASGMARGIDTYAHKGALKANGKTIAVLGCGLDKPYPPENKRLMELICENGAVVSEYLPGTPPVPYNFPARNRIISGISRGVIIVEAGEKSGSLITTDYALEQGRDVFSVPGNINSSNSAGTNRLIRDGAKIVTCREDVLEELGISVETRQKSVKQRYESLDIEEMQLVKVMGKGFSDIDDIALKCKIEVNQVSSMLLMLELKGFVEQMPGKRFKLVI